MARIFSVLAVLAILLLAANFVVGLWVGDFNEAAQNKRAAQLRMLEASREARAARKKTSPELEKAEAEYQAADAKFQPPRQRMTTHMLLGSAASLVAILVNCITVTYFIGTSRWCKEVSETYQLPRELAERSVRLKRSTFPWALAGIFAIIAIIGLGAAADPSGANFARAESFVMLHYLAAMLGLAIVVFAFWIQISRIAENYAVIGEILAEVRRIREERNLPTEEWTAP